MTGRATALQLVQFGKESTAGTAVACTKMFQNVGLDFTPAGDAFTEFTAQGQRAPSIVAPGREWTDVGLSGMLDYMEDLYLLLSLKTATPSTVTTGVYSWVITPSLSAEDTFNTYTLQKGTPQHAAQVAYAALKEYGINWTKDKAPERSGSMLAQRYADDVDLATNEVQSLTANGTVSGGHYHVIYGGQTSGTIAYDANAATIETALEAMSSIGTDNVAVTGGPVSTTPVILTFREDLGKQNLDAVTLDVTAITGGGTIDVAQVTAGAEPTAVGAVPVLPTHVDIYLADSWAGLTSADKLTGAFSASMKASDFMGMQKVINSTYTSYKGLVPKVFKNTFSLTMEADTTGMALLTTMRAGSTKFARVKCVGAQIGSTGYYYTFQVDMALKVSKPHTHSDDDGVYAVGWDFTNVYDATATKFIEFTIQNTIASV